MLKSRRTEHLFFLKLFFDLQPNSKWHFVIVGQLILLYRILCAVFVVGSDVPESSAELKKRTLASLKANT